MTQQPEPVDYDIVVVGGGPAGLSAAARAAWLGAPAADYKASILLLEVSGELGGLSKWQPLVVNSPGVLFTKRELKALTQTLEAFAVDVRFEQVIAMQPLDDGRFELVTNKCAYHALSVVIASGCRRGYAGESKLFHRKRVNWFYSNESLDHLLGQLEQQADIDSICLCGTLGVVATRRYIGKRESLDITTYAEPPYTTSIPADIGQGQLTHVGVNSKSNCLRLRFLRPGNSIDEFDTDVLLIDFNAYQATAASTGFLHRRIPRMANAYLNPDRRMAVGIAGLFSAGDVNGAPFAVVNAMSDGTVAGFSAYQYVCVKRSGRQPNLFPFFPYEI